MSKLKFSNLEELKACIEEDKQATGMGASTRNRYPIRFILFDNFRDCYEFVDYLQHDQGARVESVDKWIDPHYPDIMISYIELAERIEEYIKTVSPNDCVIAPFSELARFYDNEEKKSFDALLKTIKAIQTTPEAFEKHQRVYIPIVGLEGKMCTFDEDSQVTIYQLSRPEDEKAINYRLILTNDTDYGVKGLESSYTLINNIREWLNLWRDTKNNVTPNIVCMSKCIYANALNAQPDNAFVYYYSHNAYEFLAEGLQLSFGGIQPLPSDSNNWEELAQRIDITNGFNFSRFVKTFLGVDEVDDHMDFIMLWLKHTSLFDRWLLARYYINKEQGQGYLCRILMDLHDYSANSLVEALAITISEVIRDMEIRKECLAYAAKQKILLSDTVEAEVARLLSVLSEKQGYTSTLLYFTGISQQEKMTAITWLKQGLITKENVKSFCPDLYYYLDEGIGVSAGVPAWVEDYMKEYKQAKLTNTYTDSIKSMILKLNENESKFDLWYNDFKTSYYLLKDRGDIEVFFWVDGLGIDWIPLVKKIIAEKAESKIFLNEVMVARALLPTSTSRNKIELQRLLPEGTQLEKVGDLDSLSHKTDNVAPFTILKELDIVRKTIEEILARFIGKKIAIISDHGLTYLSQLREGLNLGGLESDHHGRIAKVKHSGVTKDSNYFQLDDEKTLCALKHESLCGKVPNHQGIHGGCTPEEVLVPVFIISGAPADTRWTATLVDMNVSGTNPKVRFTIKDLPSTEVPYVVYNNIKYKLHCITKDTYESEDMALENGVNELEFVVGSLSKFYKINISTGAEENDLF